MSETNQPATTGNAVAEYRVKLAFSLAGRPGVLGESFFEMQRAVESIFEKPSAETRRLLREAGIDCIASPETLTIQARRKPNPLLAKIALKIRAALAKPIGTSPTRRGGWMQTFTDRQFWPLDARPEEVFIEDIAGQLAHVNRFGGGAGTYSVAQHCVLVSQQVPPESALWGLLHDASEAYLGDQISTLKGDPAFAPLNDAHAALQRVICDRFGLPHEEPSEVKEADRRMLYTEKRDLRGPAPAPWLKPAEPFVFRIEPWTPQRARQEFLDTFHSLCREVA